MVHVGPIMPHFMVLMSGSSQFEVLPRSGVGSWKPSFMVSNLPRSAPTFESVGAEGACWIWVGLACSSADSVLAQLFSHSSCPKKATVQPSQESQIVSVDRGSFSLFRSTYS